MPTISKTQLIDRLMNLRGAKFATIVAETDPRMRKTGNPFVGATKISRVNGVVNWIYQNSVNNQRVRENQPLDNAGEVEYFEPEPRRWGTRLKHDTGHVAPLVEHKGKHYLELKVERSLGHEYRLNGQTLDPQDVAEFLPERKESARQRVDNPVILRDYSLDNIKTITIDGVEYTMEEQG